ncbi:MAG: bacterial Ig-like domain-containing protein, partial [Clostridiales bacterium]|nr:bacterial Ig-like domain-containing protein [Clostridiales bacterium]
IEITSLPEKTTYTEGETLDLTGLVVTAHYSDGSLAGVANYYANPMNGALLGVIGAQTVTISYSEEGVTKTASFSVTVEAVPVVLTGIEITSLPEKTTYTEGETFDLTGLVVTAVYSDGNSAGVANYSTNPVNSALLGTIGAQTVTVSYTEEGVTKTASFIITVEAVPEPPIMLENPFPDIEEGDLFYGDIIYVYSKGLMIGTGVDQPLFSPDMLLTRGMVITVLYRMAGSPNVSGLDNPFSDVAGGVWYAEAMIWAAHNGLLAGYSSVLGLPEEEITREDMVILLLRYADFAKMNLPVIREDAGFSDEADVSEYAKSAVERAYCLGIINVKNGNRIDAQGKTTRAEFAAIVRGMLEAGK